MSNSILQLLAAYGNTGSEQKLMNIVSTKQKFGAVHLSLAVKVGNKLLQTIRDPNKTYLRHAAWKCLSALCERDVNLNAEGFLFNLQYTNVITLAKLGFRQGVVPDEQKVIVNFLRSYARRNDFRCNKILEQRGLLQDLLSVVESFEPDNSSEWVSISEALRTLTYILESSNLPVTFVAQGGKNVLAAVLSKTVTTIQTNPGAREMILPVVIQIVGACTACTKMLAQKMEQLDEVWIRNKFPVSCVFYSKEQMLSVMKSWYYMLRFYFQLVDDDTKADIFDKTLFALSITLTLIYRSDIEPTDQVGMAAFEEGVSGLLQDIFRFRTAMELAGESTDAEAPTFIQFVINVARDQQRDIDEVFLPIVRTYPALLELVEEQVGKLIFCAHPECNISNFLPKRLKKCERCMSVWYCSREHQVAHWKAGHKNAVKKGSIVLLLP